MVKFKFITLKFDLLVTKTSDFFGSGFAGSRFRNINLLFVLLPKLLLLFKRYLSLG